ncbi:MAG: hypothetical protein PVJ57_06220 [Phycisphaerae bacterium]|jgi:hypothetical protein
MHLRLVRHWWPVSDPLYVSPRLWPPVYFALLTVPVCIALADIGNAAAIVVTLLLGAGLIVYSIRLTRWLRAAYEPRFSDEAPAEDARVICCGEGVQLDEVQAAPRSSAPLRAYVVLRSGMVLGTCLLYSLSTLVVGTFRLLTTGVPDFTLPAEYATLCVLAWIACFTAPFWCNLLWGTIVEVAGGVLTLRRRWCLWWPGRVLKQVDLREASVECRFDDMKLLIGPTAQAPAGLKIGLWRFVRPHRLAAAVLRAAEG